MERCQLVDIGLHFLKFTYSFLTALGFHCLTWMFSSCGQQGLLFTGVSRLLAAGASLVAEHGPWVCGFSTVVLSCSMACGVLPD